MQTHAYANVKPSMNDKKKNFKKNQRKKKKTTTTCDGLKRICQSMAAMLMEK